MDYSKVKSFTIPQNTVILAQQDEGYKTLPVYTTQECVFEYDDIVLDFSMGSIFHGANNAGGRPSHVQFKLPPNTRFRPSSRDARPNHTLQNKIIKYIFVPLRYIILPSGQSLRETQ